jgi:hypothetical protein
MRGAPPWAVEIDWATVRNRDRERPLTSVNGWSKFSRRADRRLVRHLDAVDRPLAVGTAIDIALANHGVVVIQNGTLPEASFWRRLRPGERPNGSRQRNTASHRIVNVTRAPMRPRRARLENA